MWNGVHGVRGCVVVCCVMVLYDVVSSGVACMYDPATLVGFTTENLVMNYHQTVVLFK